MKRSVLLAILLSTLLLSFLSHHIPFVNAKTTSEDSEEESLPWYDYIVYSGISITLVLFGGLMSGLTLGLLSIEPMELQILKNAGTAKEKFYARNMERVLANHHLVLVTLLLWNALAMEALPLFLDRMVPEVVAILLSVSFVLIFGEILPQAVCSRYGLAIGGNLWWLVATLMIVVLPISYPISKVLDFILGHQDSFYRRAELKELVQFHMVDQSAKHSKEHSSNELEKLTFDEVTVIRGALDMKEKQVGSIMTPIADVFMLSSKQVLTLPLLQQIKELGFSRIPVYLQDDKSNVVGLVLVKKLIDIDFHNPPKVEQIKIRPITRVNSDENLWTVLNEFQLGKSHMSLVTDAQSQQIIGIVTLEDVIEELLQEEIIDETDQYVNVSTKQKRSEDFYDDETEIPSSFIVSNMESQYSSMQRLKSSRSIVMPEHSQDEEISMPFNSTSPVLSRSSRPIKSAMKPLLRSAASQARINSFYKLPPTEYESVAHMSNQTGTTIDLGSSPNGAIRDDWSSPPRAVNFSPLKSSKSKATIRWNESQLEKKKLKRSLTEARLQKEEFLIKDLPKESE